MPHMMLYVHVVCTWFYVYARARIGPFTYLRAIGPFTYLRVPSCAMRCTPPVLLRAQTKAEIEKLTAANGPLSLTFADRGIDMGNMMSYIRVYALVKRIGTGRPSSPTLTGFRVNRPAGGR